MPWLELQLSIAAAAQLAAEAALQDAGALSVTLMDAAAGSPGEAAILEPGVGEIPLWPVVKLLGLFAAGSNRRALLQALHAALPELAPEHVGFVEVADRDWTRAWMDRFHPMRFGRRLWIYPRNLAPSDERIPHLLPSAASGGRGARIARSATGTFDDEARVIVRLDPGLAFGTGSHPTTALCLEWLDGLDLAGKTVIDYGCGSGVLAIAALKLGAAHGVGVDNDPQALTASHDNAARNGVAGRLALFVPGALPGALRADVLIANILSAPLCQLAPRLAALLQSGAPFALSGILAGQEDELVERYRSCGFAKLRVAHRGGWVRIDGVRRGNEK